MSWTTVNNPADAISGATESTADLVDLDMGFTSVQLLTTSATQGYEVGTILNPAYGSGIELPVIGIPQYAQPCQGEQIPRPPGPGIVYP